jgi:hypothetical protein
MISFSHKGDFSKTMAFLKKSSQGDYLRGLDKYAKKGVDALMQYTPIDSGKTAHSWGYEIEASKGSCTITWTNSNQNQGVPIAIILQYGHGTGTGGYVQGKDYINPAIRPIFDEIADHVWKEVTRS